jgi:Icc protein
LADIYSTPTTKEGKMSDEHRVDRRGFLQCMTWAGTGVLWSVTGGVLSSRTLGVGAAEAQTPSASFNFVQISDSHIGFKGEANKDVMGSFEAAIARIKALDPKPAFMIHTGDITHTQKPGAFDLATEALKGAGVDRTFYIPGENDVFADGGTEYLNRFAAGRRGWQSFDYQGVHFVGLINVLNFKAGGLGDLGPEQLQWLERDVAALSSSTPVVVYAHVPLWSVYPKWGWVTDDGAQALGYLKRFGSVTVLNGHIHQIMQKVEGNITFHTARSTAFPQPAPGVGPGPGPLKVPVEELSGMLGVRDVSYVAGKNALAVVDTSLASAAG